MITLIASDKKARRQYERMEKRNAKTKPVFRNPHTGETNKEKEQRIAVAFGIRTNP